jgi:hypothetical protein
MGEGVLDDTPEKFNLKEDGIATTDDVLLHDTKLGENIYSGSKLGSWSILTWM